MFAAGLQGKHFCRSGLLHSVHPITRARRAPGRGGRMAQQITEALAKLDAMIAGAAPAGTAAGAAAGAPTTAAGGGGGSIRQELAALFRGAIAAAFPGAEPRAAVAACNNPAHGDYQCNDAMALFGRLKGAPGAPKSPRAVAEAIVAALPPSDMVAETSLAGPGFINVRLSDAWLAARLDAMLAAPGGAAAWAPAGHAGARVVVDFSSPNVAKEMHVGHLRSTIIGDTLARLLEFCGARVLRLNHIGDWGTQFGMLIQFMAEKRPGGLGAVQDEDVADLQVLYRAAKARFDEDAEFKTRAREAVRELQGGRPEYLAAWRRICAASRAEFQKIYDRLGVELLERGESHYNPALQATVDDLKARGVAVESDGATCVFVDGEAVPLIVQKSDGGFGYASTDMAALKQRVDEERADWIIYVTDVGQAQHFKLVFGAAAKAGYLPRAGDGKPAVKIDHVGFGLVLGDDGKKFRSRSGDVVRLVELLDEARARCEATILERRPDIAPDELAAAAAAMGYGAVKYADLKSHRLTNYRFSFDEMLALQGNTAVYLLYAHARIASIARKAGKDVDALLAGGARVRLGEPAERALALAAARFPEAVEEALADLAPNRLCEYLYELAGAYSTFYTECHVVGTPEEAPRLLLCEATARVMRQGLQLLGITPLFRI